MKPVATLEQYAAAFERECAQAYPEVEAFEARMGFAIDRVRLEAAARVLACPVKANPPCWQHGRVIYAAVRHYASGQSASGAALLDIGTAKGFSALCLLWARQDADVPMSVWSCDVINPGAATRRNTVAEVDGLKTLEQTLSPWPESTFIAFSRSTGIDMLTHWTALGLRCGVAFVDGKHEYPTVKREAELLRGLQRRGDIAIFDDLQIPGVHRAVAELQGYDVTDVNLSNGRRYGVAVRQ